MNKIFYKLDIDTSQNYSDLSKFINLLSKNQIESFYDTTFLRSIEVRGFVINIQAKDRKNLNNCCIQIILNLNC